jgi:site-specific recombinase XerD
VTAHLQEVGLGAKTIENYTGHLSRAERWCEQQGTNLLSVTGDQLHAFVLEQGPSHGNRRALRCALEYYWRNSGRVDPPVYAVTIPARPGPGRRALEPPEAMTLASTALERADRHGLAVLLVLLAGLTGSQVAQLRWDDLHPGGLLEARDSAGRVSTVPIHEAVSVVLGGLRRRTEWVFPSRGAAGHVGVDTIYDWVSQISTTAGIAGVTTDCIRRSRISDEAALVKLARRRGRRGSKPAPGEDRLDAFRVGLTRRGLSPRTVALYSSNVARAERWCSQRSLNLVEISYEELGAFVALLPQTHATLRVLRKALQHYFDFHHRSDPPLWVIRSLPRPRMVCQTLEPEEAKRSCR